MATKKEKKPISIVDRRRASGSIFGTGSKPIPMKDPSWVIRCVNSKVSNQHLYNMRSEKLWEYVTLADLDCTLDEIGYKELDGRIVRGEKGEEVLMKMPTKDFAAIQRDKEVTNLKNTLGKKATRNTILGAMHAAGDDAGASYMEKALNAVEVKDGVERVPLGD